MRSFIFAVLLFASLVVVKAEPVTSHTFVQTEAGNTHQSVYGRMGFDPSELR